MDTAPPPARGLLVVTGLFVAGLALVAGAISFDHMRELANQHGQLGWRAYAFPISVDGLEVVASLYLVAQRRAGRPTGWVPWASLVVGTLASLAANVAVGGDDLVGKALAGWPALSMLASVKLFFGMFDHADRGQPIVRNDRPNSIDVTDIPETVHTSVPAGKRTATLDALALADLMPSARAARSALASRGRRLTRDGLADQMRDDGYAVSNESACALTKILRAEEPPSGGAGIPVRAS